MASLSEPIIRTQFTDVAAGMFTFQNHEVCKDFELRFVHCVEAYGKPLGDTKCKDFKDDLSECLLKPKQMSRVIAMKKERARQYNEGERKKEDYFGPTPKADSY